jgi:hypothetical protein
LIKLRHVAIHRKHTIRSIDTKTLRLCFFQLFLQIGHIGIGIAIAFGFGKSDAIDDGSMIERIGNNGILFLEQRLEKASIGIKTGCIKNSIFRLKKTTDRLFQFFVIILRSTNEAHR